MKAIPSDVITDPNDPRLTINQPQTDEAPAAAPDASAAPDDQEAAPIEVGRMVTYLPPENRDLSDIRAQHEAELQDPTTRYELYNLTHNEVGGQGPEAQQAFMESVLNRATARNQSLAETINDTHYYPAQSFKTAALSGQHMANYNDILQNVIDGSNISRYATGNASGGVGFNGGPRTASFGGEHFGIEGPDQGWHGAAPTTPTTLASAAKITGPAVRGAIGEMPQRALLAGLQPTFASMQAAGAGDATQMQAAADRMAGVGADEGTLGPAGGAITQTQEAIPEAAGEKEGDVIVGDAPVPDVTGMKITPLGGGTVQFGEGDGAIKYNPSSGITSWDWGPRTFVKMGPFGKVSSFNNQHYYHDISTNRLFDLNKRDANGQPLEIKLPGTQPHIDQALWNKIIDMGAPIAKPDGTPFQNNLEAMRSLQEYQQTQGLPTKFQEHVIDQVTNSLKSGRNPYIRAYLQQAPNYQSAMENINLPSRNGVDDAMLIASYYGIERPGYAPTQADLNTFMSSLGLVGKAAVGAQRVGALKSALSDLINGKQIGEDASVTLNAGRIIPDQVLPQMKAALQRALEPRWKMYEAGVAPFRHQLEQAGIRNPDLYIPDVKPDFVRDQETAQGQPNGAPAAPAATPAAVPPISSNVAWVTAQKVLATSNDPVQRVKAEAVLNQIQQGSVTPTPTPTP
jgi:hypothetical protein